MAFSMHSHSGQFCPGHAKDTLEEVVLRAISLKFHLFALTEHMPRDQDQDLYPEEIQANITSASLLTLHHAYITEALRLRAKYASSITLLIGFEGEWIRPSSSVPFIPNLLALPGTDFFIGSVHHVFEIPIDYDAAMYARACTVAGERRRAGEEENEKGDEELLFEAYFDAQWQMLNALRPRVVGHFDLIRLLSAKHRDDQFYGMEGVWMRIRRNLKAILDMGGLIEVNSSALRKGLRDPYPGKMVCHAFMAMGGKFTLSDDSHGVAQVGLNYGRVSEYLSSLGVTKLHYLERLARDEGIESEAGLVVKEVPFTGLDIASFPSTALP